MARKFIVKRFNTLDGEEFNKGVSKHLEALAAHVQFRAALTLHFAVGTHDFVVIGEFDEENEVISEEPKEVRTHHGCPRCPISEEACPHRE